MPIKYLPNSSACSRILHKHQFFFSGVKLVWIQCFPSPRRVAVLRLKIPICFTTFTTVFTHSWLVGWLIEWLILTARQLSKIILCLDIWELHLLYGHINFFVFLFLQRFFLAQSFQTRIILKQLSLTRRWDPNRNHYSESEWTWQ